jgi:PhoH-like ATPase
MPTAAVSEIEKTRSKTPSQLPAKTKKVFVLDTSVILYDHRSITEFDEHDVAIPIQVLEELDNFKKGNDHKNFEAREFIRFLDQKLKGDYLNEWLPLNGKTKGKFKVIMTRGALTVNAEEIFDSHKNDHKILNAALALQRKEPEKKVVLVTKDVALRLKAKSLNLHAEDFETGKVKDLSKLYTGKRVVEKVHTEVIDRLFRQGRMDVEELGLNDLFANEFLILKNGKKSVLAWYNAMEELVERIEKKIVYGIKPRNAEQAFTIHAILDPTIQLVSIQGVAGTGKTLLALAAALEQRRNFQQIYITRPVVPLSNKDIGYLPGDIKSKLNPYMEPLWDNLKFIKSQYKETDKAFKAIDQMVETEKIHITPLTYIRGRSMSNVIFIVDEAQNLTPHEIKTIITRAGENTKIIFTGDIMQIDSPYLDSHSNGLTTMIEKLKGSKLFAHVTLEKGERSELANLANDLL